MVPILSFCLHVLGILGETTGATVRFLPRTEAGPTQGKGLWRPYAGKATAQFVIRPLKQEHAWTDGGPGQQSVPEASGIIPTRSPISLGQQGRGPLRPCFGGEHGKLTGDGVLV